MDVRVVQNDMKHTSNRLLLLLAISASAFGSQGSAPSAQAGSFFVGGCALILLTMARLLWKTRGIGK
jgi:hypothetical protein